MAIDGANLNGAFPVFDVSRSVNTYTADLARQAAQRQAEQKALQHDLDKVKIDGLRDADKEDYFRGFDDWRTTAQAAANNKDFRQSANLQREADKKRLELQSLVNKSKEYGRLHQDVSSKFLDNRFRDQFPDDAPNKWLASGNMALSNPNIILDPNSLGRQVDLSAIPKILDNIDDELFKQARYDNKPATRSIAYGNRTGTESIYTRSVDPKEQALRYGLQYDLKRDMKAAVRQQYADAFNTMPEDQAKAFAIHDLVKQRPISRQDAPKLNFDLKEEHWKEKALFNDMLARKRKDIDGSGIGIAQPITIPYGSGDKKGNVTMDEYVPISVSKKNFAGSEYIDLKTGKVAGKLKSSNDYEIVGVGNAPFIKSSLKGQLAGAIAQPDFAKKHPDAIERKPIVHVQVPATADNPISKDYFVPYDRLPENVKNSKSIKEVLYKFKPTTSAKSAPASKKNDPLGIL